jgi:hypothetical protein
MTHCDIDVVDLRARILIDRKRTPRVYELFFFRFAFDFASIGYKALREACPTFVRGNLASRRIAAAVCLWPLTLLIAH